MSRIKNARRNITWNYICKIVSVVIPFVLRTVIIYRIGSNYLGLDSLFNSILQMLNITELGFSSAIVYGMYKPLAEENADEVCALLGLYKKVYRIIGAVVLALGLVIVPFLPVLIKSDLPSNINVYMLYLIFLINTVLGYWLFAYKKSLLSACQREDLVSKATTLTTIVKFMIQVAVLILLKNYYVYAMVLVLSTCLENIEVNYLSNKYYPQYIPCGIVSIEKRHDIGEKTKGLLIQRICETSRNSLDSIIISAYLGLNTVTIYGNYFCILSAIHGIMAGMTRSVLGIVGNTVAQNSVQSNYEDMIVFNFMYMCLASCCTVIMSNTYQPFMEIWMGSNRLLPYYVVVAMCAYFYSMCIGEVRSIYNAASGLWWEGRYRSILESVVNLTLNIVLGKYFGVMGIVLATIISIIAINFGYGTQITYRYYFKKISPKRFYAEHIYYFIITVIAIILSHCACNIIAWRGLIKLFANGALSFLVSLITIIIFCHRLRTFKEAIKMINKIAKLDKNI